MNQENQFTGVHYDYIYTIGWCTSNIDYELPDDSAEPEGLEELYAKE